MEEMFNNYNDAAKKEVKYGLSKTSPEFDSCLKKIPPQVA